MTREQRLSCNRIFRHLNVYCQQRFTGQLAIESATGASWQLYLVWGRLAWATGGDHPYRRWRRQFYLATGRVPEFPALRDEAWDYRELVSLAGRSLSADQVRQVAVGTVSEVLFDIVQTFEQPLADEIAARGPLLTVASLAGLGDGMTIKAKPGEIPCAEHRFPSTWLPDFKELQPQIQRSWERWAELGLAGISPNAAPYVGDRDALFGRTTSKVFRNLVRILDGKRTLRDIAVKVDRHPDILRVVRLLAPLMRTGAIATQASADLAIERTSAPASTFISASLLVGIEAGYLGNLPLLAAETGLAYEGFENCFTALHRLASPDFPTPSLILIAENNSILSSCEICSLLRRIEKLQTVPIAIYSPLSADRKQIRDAYKAGATQCLSCNELGVSRFLALLQAPAAPPSGQTFGQFPERSRLPEILSMPTQKIRDRA